jgi:FkbM family methyltransferase
MTEPEHLISKLFDALPGLSSVHAPGTSAYELLRTVARQAVETLFSDTEAVPRAFGPFGSVRFPFTSMGAINSLDLFGLDELILFSFYWVNRSRYKRVLDLGSNIGLHAIVLARCGMEVRSYEPDPVHFKLLQRNLEINQCGSVEPINAAVSTAPGQMEFVRVLGNTTGSHLAGSKSTVYGNVDRFPVSVEAFSGLIGWADLVKLDVEGHERLILVETTRAQWESVDAVAEIGSAQNADAVFDHFRRIGVNLFAQKVDWARVERREHMPESYRDGTLFISSKEAMPW